MMMNLCNDNTSSSSSFSSSAQEIEESEDLLIQILLHLPVKSLLGFKCVCKKWKSLISSQYFSINHTQRNPNPISSSLLMLRNQSLILLSLGHHENNPEADFRIPSFDFFNITPDTTMRILGICNGLMLSYISSSFNENEYAFCVSNITTRQLTNLPPPGKIINKPILGINLAFDPSNSPHFKVICFGQSFMLEDKSCQLEIYSSETGLWKLWNGSFSNPFHILEVFDRGVFCNGAIHWLSTISDSFYFVLEKETMKTLPMPPMHRDIYTTKRLRFLGQSGGYLNLIDFEANLFHNPPMDIYEMKKDYSEWVLKYRIDLNELGLLFPEMIKEIQVHSQKTEDEHDVSVHISKHYLCSVLSVRRAVDGESVEIIMLLPQHIIAYNPMNNCLRVLLWLDKGTIQLQDHKWYDCYQFTETLSWLN
ncbi:hypothetical protein ACH5RR_003815 [Cinchona calisaya]|uniref:F-box domain-containing protein n=1 Tax=Cinchona calisaya TaxID=153742 RepID=A0ABD3AWI6_9GENT